MVPTEPSSALRERKPQGGARMTIAALWRGCWKPALATPFAVGAVMAGLELAGWLPPRIRVRNAFEAAALVVLALALLLALARLVQQRTGPRWWVAALVAVLLCREIHFTGAGSGVYVGLAVLFAVLVRSAGAWLPLLGDRRFATPLVAAFTCYFVSQTLDQRWWQWLPYEDRWEVPAEETVEVAGHLCIVLLAWIAPAGSADARN